MRPNHQKIKRQTNEEYKLTCNIRKRIYNSLRGVDKELRTSVLLGCKLEGYKQWIQFQFNSNMNWVNYGTYWEIDHVIPCALFNLVNEEEQLKCFNWKNCRPLECIKNRKKSNKLVLFDITIQELKVKIYMQHIQIAGTSL